MPHLVSHSDTVCWSIDPTHRNDSSRFVQNYFNTTQSTESGMTCSWHRRWFKELEFLWISIFFLQRVYKSLSGRLLINSRSHKKVNSVSHTHKKTLSQGNIKSTSQNTSKNQYVQYFLSKKSWLLLKCAACVFWSFSVLGILLQKRRMGEWSLDFQSM